MAAVDTLTQRPRTPNDPYTVLTDQQIRNIKKDPSPFFHTDVPQAPAYVCTKSGGRFYRDRYSNLTSEHLVRGGQTQPYCWIDNQWSRHVPDEYNTCRGRAAVRWGPQKSGERTRSHFFGESINNYSTIDMYRRPATNYAGPVLMHCGRASEGYYAQRNPSFTTWFGASMPLNRASTMTVTQSRTVAEYEAIKDEEQTRRMTRKDKWPEYSEYTDRYLLHTKTDPKLSSMEERKMRQKEAQAETERPISTKSGKSVDFV